MGMKSIEIFLKEEKKGQYGHEQYRNLPEGEKQGQLSIEKTILECKN